MTLVELIKILRAIVAFFFDALTVRNVTLFAEQIFEGDKLQHTETVRQKTKNDAIKIMAH